jgi:peptidoglycan/xylan/chitin deacetylase (PgdA/CDA1 family)
MHYTMRHFRQIAGTAMSVLWGEQRNWSSRRSQILMYHSIGGRADGDMTGLYSISPKNFMWQMQYLAALCRQGLLRVVPFGQEQAGCVSITFDDGYVDNLTVAVPILEKFNFPFHIFVSPEMVVNRREGLLSIEQVRILSKHPLASLGVHGYSHVPLTNLDSGEIEADLSKAVQWLSETSGQPVKTLSYPHGAVNSSVMEAVAKCGIVQAACSKFGPIRVDTHKLRLPRIDIWSSDSERSFAAKITGRWDWMKWRT